MWMFIFFIIACIVVLSPFAVIVLLIERSSLKQQLQWGDVNSSSSEGEYTKGYYQALEDVQITAKTGQSDPLSVDEAVRTLKNTVQQPDSPTEVAQTLSEAISEDAVSSGDELLNEDSIWGGTLDGSKVQQPAPQHSMQLSSQKTRLATDPQEEVEPSPSGMSPQSIINVVLFSGAFLIVGAAAAFVVTSANPLLKALSIWMAIFAFYGGGVWLRGRSNLQQIGVAFLGIGLALVPFAGLVLSATLDVTPLLSWFIVSCVAVGLTVHMAWLIRSEVTSYLTIFSLLSLALAISRNVSDDIFWLVVPIMLVGFILQFVQTYARRSLESWVYRPVSTMSVISPAVALLLCVPYFSQLGYVKSEIIVALATVQFILQALSLKSYSFELLARVTGTVLFGIIGTHVAAKTSFEFAESFGVALSVAMVVQVAATLLLRQKRDEDTAEVESLFVKVYLGVAWAIAFSWFMTATASAAMMIGQLLVIVALSIIVGITLRHTSYFYNAIVALWLTPYAAVTLPRLVSGDVAETLAWYYIGLSVVLSIIYSVCTVRSRLRDMKFAAWLALMLHSLSALIHSIAIGDVPLGLSLVLAAVVSGLFAWGERSVKFYIVSHVVTLLAAQQLLIEAYGHASLWRAIIATLSVGLGGWLMGEVLLRGVSKNLKPNLTGSSIAMLFFGFVLSWQYAVTHDLWAYLGVAALVCVALILGIKAYTVRQAIWAELAVYVTTAATLYGVYIADKTSYLPFVTYAVFLAFVAAGMSFYERLAKRRSTHHLIAQGALAVGTLSTLGWGFGHELRGFWGVGSLAAMAMLFLAHYRNDRRSLWLEWALYASTLSVAYAVTILDINSSIPAAFYGALLGTVAAIAGTISDTASRRQSHYTVGLIVLSTSFLLSLGQGFAHELAGLWGGCALLVCAGILLLQSLQGAHGSDATRLKEWALYIATGAACYGIFILDKIEYLPGIFYLHILAVAVTGAGYLYEKNEREARLKAAVGLLTGVVGLKALSSGGGYSLLFLLEHVFILLAGAVSSRRWMMLWAAASISLAVLYFLRDNSWLVLLVIGLLLVGYAVVRSTRTAPERSDKSDQ